MTDLNGKMAIVTGASQGIGFAYAEALAGAGAAVVIADIDTQNGDNAVKLILDAGGRALFVETDVSSESSVQCLVDTTGGERGGIDIVVNNAGIWGHAEKSRLAETTLE